MSRTMEQKFEDGTRYLAVVSNYEEYIIVTAKDYTKVFATIEELNDFMNEKEFKFIN